MNKHPEQALNGFRDLGPNRLEPFGIVDLDPIRKSRIGRVPIGVLIAFRIAPWMLAATAIGYLARSAFGH